MKEEYPFLFQEWIHEVTRVVQGARAKDEDFKKQTSDYSLNLAYVITDLPAKLRELYSNEGQLVLFVKLDKGTVQELVIGTEIPEEKIDFTVFSSYSTAKQIFMAELNPATAFINRQLKVEPLGKVYRRPRFAAKSIITGNMILQIARQVPTRFVVDNEESDKTTLLERE